MKKIQEKSKGANCSPKQTTNKQWEEFQLIRQQQISWEEKSCTKECCFNSEFMESMRTRQKAFEKMTPTNSEEVLK